MTRPIFVRPGQGQGLRIQLEDGNHVLLTPSELVFIAETAGQHELETNHGAFIAAVAYATTGEPRTYPRDGYPVIPDGRRTP